jgi:hypothetical protein
MLMRLVGWNFFTASIGSTLRLRAPNAYASWWPRQLFSKPSVARRIKCDWPTPIVGIWNWPGQSDCQVIERIDEMVCACKGQ